MPWQGPDHLIETVRGKEPRPPGARARPSSPKGLDPASVGSPGWKHQESGLQATDSGQLKRSGGWPRHPHETAQQAGHIGPFPQN